MPDVAVLLAAIRALPADRTRWVGVDGLGASGKTTLAQQIADHVPHCAIVHLDDFQGEGITEWDWQRFGREVVTPLRDGRPARYAIRAWGDAAPSGHGEVMPGSLVVVEGVSATRREADVPWDLTVWVDAPEDVRTRRRHERDGGEGSPTEAIWREHWLVTEQAYAARERPWERVDLVINS